MSDDEEEYIPDEWVPGEDTSPSHPASGSGPHEIPNVSGETAEIADEMDFNRAQAEYDKEKH